MQKITRVYVGNYGIDMAWYDGIVFDMTDPETGEPTDTILNLENGGGKTTLLSFIFSCFETAQERFLKHIQNKNHRFSQYFARDGLPGVILVEWEMPSRVAGGAPYRLVIGQVVAVRSNAERDEVDRVFFSFESCGGLRFESVPAPKLTMAPANNMAEFSRWMHEAQKLAPDFFHTRTQQDWQKHLRDERLIDVEMLQLQVNFSAQEGGMDAGFLTFHSEPEFIRKFFDLTLDTERSAAVRLAVVNTCDKLRRKPIFQLRLKELDALHGGLTQFDSLAQDYGREQESQRDTLVQGGGLVLGLEARNRVRSATVQNEFDQAKAQGILAVESEAAEKSHSAEEIVLTSHWHQRQVTAAEKVKAGSDGAHSRAKEKLRHVQGAKARSEISAAEAQKNALESQAAYATEELQPWRDTVEKYGSILRRALFDEEKKLRNEAKSAETHELEAKSARKELASELGRLSGSEKTFIEEQAALKAAEASFFVAKNQLINDQLLEPNENTLAATQRWSTTADDQTAAEARSLFEAEQFRAQEQNWRDQSNVESAEVARLEATIKQRQQFVAEGEAERESLSQLQVMRLAADAETADPDSLALMAALDRLAHSSEREVSLSDVHLAELHASKSSIEETGVAGSSRDVNAVIAGLRELGVKSAQAYNTYISKAIPNAELARTLVASNPARFLGVHVASSEFERARGLASQPPKLSSPVMISVTTLDATAVDGDRIVISAAGDAAFNIEAAETLLSTLESRVSAENERRKIHADRQRDALVGKQRLEAYVQRFGGDALQKAGASVIQLTLEVTAAKERAVLAESTAIECRKSAVTCQAEAGKYGQSAKDAERHVRDIQRFAKTHEDGRASSLARMDELGKELVFIVERRVAISIAQAQQEDAEKEAYRTRVDLDTRANVLGNERGTLKYYDKGFPAAEHLSENPQELSLLRQLYSDAGQTFESQEKDRLGLLHQQLESARTQVTEKTQAFTKNFPGLQAADIAPYQGANFDGLIPATQVEIGRADTAEQEAGNALAVAKSKSSEYHRANKPGYAPSAEMVALSDVDLFARTELVASLRLVSKEAARVASSAAARATELAKQAELDAREMLNTAKNLRAALTLPELIVADQVELASDINNQAIVIVAEFQSRSASVERARKKAHKAFDTLKTVATSKSLQDVEPEIATQLQRNDFEATCADSQRLLDGILDRIGTTQSSLEGMKADFDACVGELSNLTNSAITLLNSAVNNKKVPDGAPYVGGKPIIKMRARFQDIPQDARRQALQNYLDSLIDTNIVPAKGPELVADALLRIHGKALGLQMLKMVPDEALQYVPVDKIQNSGGEGVVMAMFLYLLINQLRSETQAKLKKTGGGPLILDNPFAKATTPTLWKAQRMLAQSMDVQLIFATALPDYNTVGEFNRFIRLRKAGKNTKTGRWHLETADFKLRGQEAEVV